MSEAPLSILALCELLDARPITPDARHDWDACPVCGVQTPPGPGGHRALCYRCTCRELGANAYDLAVCRTHRITLARWRQIGDEAALPSITYREWRRRLGR